MELILLDGVIQLKNYPNLHVGHVTQELQRELNAQPTLKNLHQKDRLNGDLDVILHF